MTTARFAVIVGILAVIAGAIRGGLAFQGERGRVVPAPAMDETAGSASTGVAVLAGGCFWGVFQHVTGVTGAVSGYAGGDRQNAEYERVGSGRTGHAESVQITFDPRKISYGRLLQIFFSVAHNPTELNRQGPDHGPQYRTEIFPQNDEQAKIAKAYVAQLDAAKVFPKPIVTKTATMKAAFYPAEAYHQDYATLHPSNPYIVFNDAPKDAFRDKPVLVAEAAK